MFDCEQNINGLGGVAKASDPNTSVETRVLGIQDHTQLQSESEVHLASSLNFP